MKEADDCPKCGTSVAWSVRHVKLGYADPPGERRNAGKHITGNFPCRSCGYNLRGMERDGQCPECGASVNWSLNGYRLGYADKSWLERLRSGAYLVLVAINVLVFGGAVLFLMGSVIKNMSAGSFAELFVEWTVTAWLATSLIAYAVGVWKMTTVEPNAKEIGRAAGFRLFARYVTAGSAVGFLLPLINRHFDFVSRIPEVIIVSTFAMFASHVAFAGILRSLAERTPSRSDNAFLQMYQWVIGVTFTSFWGLVYFSSGGSSFDTGCCMAVLIVGACFVFGLWFLGGIAGAHSAIKKALNEK